MARNRWMWAPVVATRGLLPTILALVLAAAWLAACSGGPPEVAVDDPELVSGRNVYARNCASCHGSDGGGGVGTKLSDGVVVAAYPDIKDQIDLIANGQGRMPAYAGRLSGEEMQAVARYTREVL